MSQTDYQNYGRSRYSSDEARGYVRVTNDWQDTVKVTVWTHDRQRIGDFWEIDPDDTVYLMAEGVRIKARSSYKIKVGEDWGWVSLGDVGQFRRGRWYINVRDIWRATHQRNRDRDGFESNRRETPDWAR
jgi:hypothetical protein